MKNLVICGIFILVIGLFAPQIAQAQGTLYLSSLSGTSTGNASVGSDSWLAAAFLTGTDAGGYALDSVQLGLTAATGSPNGYAVMLYSANTLGGVSPASSIAALTGPSNPRTTGVYSYTAASTPSLSPQSWYFIVVSSSTPVANGAYNWSERAYPPSVSVNGWAAGNGIIQSGNGNSGWSPTPYLGIAQFAIYATPAPEPGVLGLFALGGLLIAFQRRKARS